MALSPDEVRRIAKEEARKSNVNGLLSATIASADIDGRITLHDIVLAALVPCVFAFMSAFLAAGAILIGTPTRDALTLAGRTIQLGGVLAGLRLLTDILNPFEMMAEFKEFKQWKREYYPPPDRIVTIKIETRDGDNGWRFLHLDENQSKKAIAFAREYLIISQQNGDYPTAEKYYVGSGKVWSRSEADYAEWQKFKNALLEHRLAFDQGNRWHLTEGGKRAMKRLSIEGDGLWKS